MCSLTCLLIVKRSTGCTSAILEYAPESHKEGQPIKEGRFAWRVRWNRIDGHSLVLLGLLQWFSLAKTPPSPVDGESRTDIIYLPLRPLFTFLSLGPCSARQLSTVTERKLLFRTWIPNPTADRRISYLRATAGKALPRTSLSVSRKRLLATSHSTIHAHVIPSL